MAGGEKEAAADAGTFIKTIKGTAVNGLGRVRSGSVLGPEHVTEAQARFLIHSGHAVATDATETHLVTKDEEREALGLVDDADPENAPQGKARRGRKSR